MSDDGFFYKETNEQYLKRLKGTDKDNTTQQNIYSINQEAHRDSIYSNNYMDVSNNDMDLQQEQQQEVNSDDETESVLSEISNESTYFEKKVHYQQRALLRKNMTLQMRQKCTNICQIITPILGLFILVLMQKLGVTVLDTFSDKVIYIPMPYLFGLNYQALANFGDFIEITTCNQWYMYNFDNKMPQEERDFFGQNDGTPWTNPKSTGMISGNGNVMTYPCNDINKTVPYFNEYKEDVFTQSTSMNDYLFNSLQALSKSSISFQTKNIISPLLDKIPDGAYHIERANDKRLKYNLQINDARYWQYHRDNGVTKIGVVDHEKNITQYIIRVQEGQLQGADIMNQAYMRTLFPNTTVISGVQYYPFTTNFDKELNRGVSVLGVLVFPICMCMCLPVFLYYIVLEKETRLVETMKINGMRMKNYWTVNFFFNFMLYSIQAAVFVLFGRSIFGIEAWKDRSLAVIIFVLLGWGLAQISMAFFISVFLNKSQTASIIGYTLSIWFTTIAVVLNVSIYSTPNLMGWFLYPIPTFTFCRLIFYISTQCAYENCIGSLGSMPTEMQLCMVALYVSFVVYLLLALYLYQVVPQTYGVPKPWNFLCKRKKVHHRHHRDTDEIGDLESEREQQETPVFDFDLSLEDQDSKNERNIVYNLDKADFYKYPLIIKDLRKVYPGFGGRPPKVATKSFCLRIKKGEMFGMLGPNGAGKTTLISILTGLYRPNQGNAWVAGYDIKNQLESVQLQIGVCPQFDILWSDLTVEEHLYFYARLKGISPDKEEAQVNKAIEEVLLQKFRNFKVKQLSGGMKRRLSVAISLVSDPKIIYLDEPSTGLDPENRRQLWDILAAQKGKRAIILTTHSMEEADVLCNRIGIVNDGILRCVGPQVRLKSIYGGGYHLFVNCQKGKVLQLIKEVKKKQIRKKMREQRKKRPEVEIIAHPSQRMNVEENKNEMIEEVEEELDQNEVQKRIVDFVKQLQPNAIMIREFNGNFVYQIPMEAFNAEKLFIEMEKNRQRLRITDWGISQCSLEDVFSRICEK